MDKPDLLNIPITFLPNVRNPSKFEEVPLKRALGQIKNGSYKELIEAARDDFVMGDDDGYKAKKNVLPSYAFHGTFNGKVINSGFDHSTGLVHFDIDNLVNGSLVKIRNLLAEDPSVVFTFVSPSGGGLKGAVLVDPALITDDASFKIAFSQVENHLAEQGVKIDTTCKDVRRVCFTSYDKDLYFNRDAEVFPLDMGFVEPIRQPAKNNPLVKVEDGYSPITENDTGILPDITIQNAYQYLPPPGEQSYAEWRDVGAAIHHQFRGSHEALDLFDRWSQDVRNYKGFEDVKKQWIAFKRTTGTQRTFKTLIKEYYARNEKIRLSTDSLAVSKAHLLLESCDDYMQLTREVAPKLWKLASRNVVLEKDFQAELIKRYAELRVDGAPLSKPEALRAMKMRHAGAHDSNISGLENPKTPLWAKGWVWVSGDEVFFNVNSRIKLTSTGFRGHYDSFLPVGEGAPTDSGKWLRDNNFIPKVMKTLYAPNFEAIFEYAGVAYVNTYNDRFRASVPDTVGNKARVEAFKTHLANLCGGWGREAHLLANFFAACTAETPLKVRWAPLLIGAVGNGKSLLHSFVSAAIGIENTRAVPSSVIVASATSGQSGWAEGHCFGFIEELKMHGHNRHDALNNLKPIITNDVIACRKLYQEVVNIPNTANWMAASNYPECAPLEDGDRRYFVIISDFKLGSNAREDYFKVLHDAITLGAGDIVRWLRDLPLHKDFNPDGHAPMTESKKVILRLTGDDLAERVAEVIEDDNNPYFSDAVVVFDPLYARLSTGFPGLTLDSTYRLTTTLSAMGYTKLTRVRLDHVRQSLWAKRVDGAVPTAEWAKAHVEQLVRYHKISEDLL